MSEEGEYALQGAQSGAALGTMLLPGIGTAAGFILGGIFGGLSGAKAHEKKRAIRQKNDRLKSVQLFSHASDEGRLSRFKAASQRALIGGAGLSTRSGSASAVESDIMAESVLQQESILAGLPKSYRRKNPNFATNGSSFIRLA